MPGNQAPSHLSPTVSPRQQRSDKFIHHQSTVPAGIHQNRQISRMTNASNNNFTYEVGNRRSSNERGSFSDKTSNERSRKVSEEHYRTSNEHLSSSGGYQHIHSHRKVSPKIHSRIHWSITQVKTCRLTMTLIIAGRAASEAQPPVVVEMIEAVGDSFKRVFMYQEAIAMD